MSNSSEEIQKEIDEARARIDQDIEALQNKFKRSTDLSTYTDNHLLPLVGGALMLGLLVAAIFVRRRPDDEPPLPPKGSRRREVAKAVKQAEKQGVLDENARKLLIGLLTTQGVQWLRQQAEEEARKAAERGQAKRAAAAESVATAVAERADKAQKSADEARQSAKKVVAEARNVVEDRTASARSTLTEKADDALAHLEEAVKDARKQTKRRRRFFGRG